jgi:diguanylate cyclase (GGDEF)-like protein
LSRRLEEAVGQAEKTNDPLAVIFIDLDRFKAVNDGAGHAFGDRVLKAVGSIINRFLEFGDIVGRQGGDEFILVLRSVHTERQVFDRIESLRQALTEEIMLDGKHIFATASFGVALFPEDGTSADELLRHADLAL